MSSIASDDENNLGQLLLAQRMDSMSKKLGRVADDQEEIKECLKIQMQTTLPKQDAQPGPGLRKVKDSPKHTTSLASITDTLDKCFHFKAQALIERYDTLSAFRFE